MGNKGWLMTLIISLGIIALSFAIVYTVICIAWWAICWLFHLTFDFVTVLVIAILFEAVTILINLLRGGKD